MVHFLDTLTHSAGMGPLESKQLLLVPQMERLLPFREAVTRALPDVGREALRLSV